MPFVCASSLTLGLNDVAIAMSFGAFGRHVGLVFLRQGQRYVAHMRFHLNVGVDDFPGQQCWIASVLPLAPTNAKILIGHLNLIGTSTPKIPFGVNVARSKGSFDAQGNYSRPSGNDGLTCATFVNEICRGVGMPLVDETTWTHSRPEDITWANEVVALLRKRQADPMHIAWVQALGVNGLRIRPEEVAEGGLAIPSKLGINFTTASLQAPALLATLYACCPDEVPSVRSGISRAVGATTG